MTTPTPQHGAMPQLLTDVENKALLQLSEAVWADLQKNELGGYSGGNRPFYLLWMFKTVIERYGYRDVGLTRSKNALDEAYERGKKDALAAIAPASAETLLRRASKQLWAWGEKYGQWQPDWLPPAGDVRLLEDIDAFLQPPPPARGNEDATGQINLPSPAAPTGEEA